jgi:hypothetical protein
MASLQQQLDLYIRNAAISGPEKELRILEVRRYLDEIEASVTLPIATVAAVSSSSDATLESISVRPVLIATASAVSAIPPFRTLASWTPVILHNDEWLTWHGEDYRARPDPVKAAQDIVKALSKIKFFIQRTCVVEDIRDMCPDIIPLAGGETAVVDLLRPHIANLKNRSKQCAKKLWTHLKAKLDSDSKAQDLWDRNVALILFSYLAAAIDIHYITGTGSSSDPGRWAIYEGRVHKFG